MTPPLPLRANLEWLKKVAKDRLDELRAHDTQAKLSDAQLAVAREYGFSSWRTLKSHVERVRDKLQELIPASSTIRRESIEVASGSVEVVRLLLAAGGDPQLLDGANRTPLDVATERGHTAIIELLKSLDKV